MGVVSLRGRMLLFGLSFLFCLIWCLEQVGAQQNLLNKGKSPEAHPENAVVLDGKQLFLIDTGLGRYSAQARAENIEKRLEKLAVDPGFDPRDVALLKSEESTEIVAGDLIIASVTDRDAKVAGRNRDELAAEYLGVLRTALADYRAKRTLSEALEDATVTNFAQVLKQILLEPMSLKFITVLIGALIISLVVRIAQRSVGRYVKDSASRYASRKVITFSGYFMVVILSIVVFRDALGNLAVIVGAATAGIAFALKEVIVSLAGWFALTFGDFYKVGDRIQLGGIKGDVIDIGFARTTLMELGEWVDGDLYTGRIVRVANSFIFSQPMFNYSGDFPYLWDEITVPVKYGSDFRRADEILKAVVTEITSTYGEDAKEQWRKIERKYLVEQARTEPMVTLVLNDNWMEFTVRYVVEVRKRRLAKDLLFRRILEEVESTDGGVGLASATFHLVETPTIDVRVRHDR